MLVILILVMPPTCFQTPLWIHKNKQPLVKSSPSYHRLEVHFRFVRAHTHTFHCRIVHKYSHRVVSLQTHAVTDTAHLWCELTEPTWGDR